MLVAQLIPPSFGSIQMLSTASKALNLDYKIVIRSLMGQTISFTE